MSTDSRTWLIIGVVVVTLGIVLSVTATPDSTGTCPAGVSQHESLGC